MTKSKPIHFYSKLSDFEVRYRTFKTFVQQRHIIILVENSIANLIFASIIGMTIDIFFHKIEFNGICIFLAFNVLWFTFICMSPSNSPLATLFFQENDRNRYFITVNMPTIRYTKFQRFTNNNKARTTLSTNTRGLIYFPKVVQQLPLVRFSHMIPKGISIAILGY